MYRYFHDLDNLTVYRVPLDADVDEERNRPNGRVIVYIVSVTVDVTRADNLYQNGYWKYPIKEKWKQQFDNVGNRYDREQAVDYFYNNNISSYSEIPQEEYNLLKDQYYAKAKSN